MDIKPPKRSGQFAGVNRRQRRAPIGDFQQTRDLRQQQLNANEDKPDAVPTSSRPISPDQPRSPALTFDFSDIESAPPEPETKQSRLSWRALRRNFSFKRAFKRASFFGGLAVLVVGGYLGVKLFTAAQNIIDRNGGGALALQGDIDPSQLSGEGDGRVNILLIGIGGDNHTGGSLADTIMVASLDPFNKDVAMLSVPRDLYVDIPGQWTTKINAAHALGEDSGFSEPGYPDGGPGLLQKTIEETLGIPIHYYARVDFDGFEQAIDAVGSITVDIPETVCDYNIAWQFGFSCIEAGTQELDSSKALFYARTRATARGDFDRGARQRLILLALRDKVLQIGTFANPLKISGLLSAAGGHVRTNLQISEILRLYEIGQDISEDKIISSGLDDYVTTGNVGGASVVLPKSGDYTEIQQYVRSIFVDGFIVSEAAQVDVLNGAGEPGLATDTAAELETYGYNILNIGDAPSADYTATKIYDLSNGSAPYTRQYLQQRFGTGMIDGATLPDTIVTDADFVIIVGRDATR
jgi:LCP family protein required for cell wall assembly